ncbi:Hypothetical_protein [Hexamita inflata]|uniref:Hypothetical_protein n=1 Tax=Hexamita inflata TaxID=28002 RepID=A0ABP1GKN7_9EUKA
MDTQHNIERQIRTVQIVDTLFSRNTINTSLERKWKQISGSFHGVNSHVPLQLYFNLFDLQVAISTAQNVQECDSNELFISQLSPDELGQLYQFGGVSALIVVPAHYFHECVVELDSGFVSSKRKQCRTVQ